MTKQEKPETSRRDFLKLAATGAPAAAAAATLAPAEAEAAAPEAGQDRRPDTAHTRAYLDSCRF